MKIAVVTDSGCGFSKKQMEDQGIYYLPLQVVDQAETYFDGIDKTIEEILDMVDEGKMLKTSLTPLGIIEELFEQLKEEGYDHAIVVPISSGLSSMSQSVKVAAEEVGLEVSVIETYTTYFIQRYIAESAKRLVDEGVGLNEIVARLNDSIAHSNTLIVPDNLEQLKRGGRLTPLAAALAGMLKIKPILMLNDKSLGKVDTFAKIRTMSKALSTAVAQAKEAGIDENYMLAIAHTNSPALAEQLKALYFDAYPNNDTYEGLLSAVIAVHTGIGCVGLQYIKKV